MKKSTLTFSVQAATYPQRLRDEILTRTERGVVSVETVVIALSLFALAGTIGGLLLAWATGKLAGLT